MGDAENDDDPIYYSRKPLMIFGRDVTLIPCFRSSFIFGISAGLFAGFICFMMTSRAKLSCDVAFGSTWLGVFGYWFPCRYKHETSILMRETGKKSVFETYLRKKVELEKLESTENKEDSKPSES